MRSMPVISTTLTKEPTMFNKPTKITVDEFFKNRGIAGKDATLARNYMIDKVYGDGAYTASEISRSLINLVFHFELEIEYNVRPDRIANKKAP